MMIERNLRSVTIRKYGTDFLEAFGMLPLTYFGARGDNLTDNYANIQVAIDESIKRGLRYIFVPNGTYFYTGNLLHVNEVIFIGNSKYAKIYDGENEIKIYQIGTQIPYESGLEIIEKAVTEPGYIDIPVKTINGCEAILVIDEDVIQVLDATVVTRNGKLFSGRPMHSPEPGTDNHLYIGENVFLSHVQILKDALRIKYGIKAGESAGTINVRLDWRVR